MYVVDCEEPYLLSFDARPTNWTFHFHLERKGQAESLVTFTRRFRGPSFWERFLDGFASLFKGPDKIDEQRLTKAHAQTPEASRRGSRSRATS